MARALLREEQIGDIDNLSEPEHDVLVHENLVTSGTLNFQDGTISGTGDIYCDDLYTSGDTIHIGDGQIKSTGDILELYYGDLKALETRATGVYVYDTAGNQSFVYFKRSNGVTAGNVNFSDGNFSIYDNINTNNIIYSVGGGAVRLHYDGSTALETYLSGIKIEGGSSYPGQECTLSFNGTTNFMFHNWETNGSFGFRLRDDEGGNTGTILTITRRGISVDGYNDATNTTEPIFLVNSDGTNHYTEFRGPGYTSGNEMGRIWHTDTDFYMRNYNDGGLLYLEGQVTSNQSKTILKGDPAGAAELYYAGTKAFETTADGFTATTSGGDTVLKSAAAGAVELYYSGDKMFETLSTGVRISDSSSNEFDLLHSGTNEFRLINKVVSGSVRILGTNSVSSTVSILAGSPNGGISLFRDGTNTFQVTVIGGQEGIKIGSSLDGHIIKHAAGKFEFRNSNIGQNVELSAINSLSSLETIFVGDPDGAAELYNAGEKQFETVVSGVEIPVDNFMYFGDTTTSGSWRMGVSGEDFIHQKYDGSTWETKQTVVG